MRRSSRRWGKIRSSVISPVGSTPSPASSRSKNPRTRALVPAAHEVPLAAVRSVRAMGRGTSISPTPRKFPTQSPSHSAPADAPNAKDAAAAHAAFAAQQKQMERMTITTLAPMEFGVRSYPSNYLHLPPSLECYPPDPPPDLSCAPARWSISLTPSGSSHPSSAMSFSCAACPPTTSPSTAAHVGTRSPTPAAASTASARAASDTSGSPTPARCSWLPATCRRSRRSTAISSRSGRNCPSKRAGRPPRRRQDHLHRLDRLSHGRQRAGQQ